MRIVLIGPGNGNIPPKGWGACESIVWDYYLNLKNDHNIIFISESNPNNILLKCNEFHPDIVHIMYDDYVNLAQHITCSNIYLTTHFAYITHPNFTSYPYFRTNFKSAINIQNKITLLALSREVADVYIKHGFSSEKIKVLRNGAREDVFRFSTEPLYPDKSIYVGKIETRKCQFKYQTIETIDFAGNYQDSSFDKLRPGYLGEWTKDVLYDNLTNYGNLILLSAGEADPLVVKEALIAGLGVVVSECAKANLDLEKPFITVIPNNKLDDINYVKTQIEINREICKTERENIRRYGLDVFSWKNIINEYKDIIS